MSITDDDLDLDPDATAAESAVDSTPLLKRIQQRRDATPDDLTLDIPTWNGELRAKYRVVERDEIEKMIRRIRARQNGLSRESAQQSGINADLDFLINACIGVYAYDIENDEEQLITSGFTAELTRLLGQEEDVKTARDLVLYLFKGQTLAIAAHGQKIARWMQDTSKPVEDPQ